MARKSVKRTSEPLYPEHPPSEHQRRVSRARQTMIDDKLDALILARNVNVFYMTGSRFVFVGMDAPVALAPQTTAIITQEADIYCQRFGPFDTDAVGLHTTLSESLEFYDDESELLNILKDYGIRSGARVGIEWGTGLCTGINPIKFLQLKEAMENELNIEIVDGTITIAKTMAIKSTLEIERMRVAVEAAARAMDRVLNYIEIGMSEAEVSTKVSQFMLEEGGERISHAQVMGQGGGLRFGSCDALDRNIEKGWVNLDIGCKFRRYGSDINRGVFLGREPTPEEMRLYECRKGVNDLLDQIIKPGVIMDDVIAQMKDFVERRGCVLKKNRGAYFAGHNIGLENYQPPSFAPSYLQPAFQNEEGKVAFESGMMFTYEMPVELPGCNAAFNIEDDVLVTNDGVENMNSMLSREVRVKI